MLNSDNSILGVSIGNTCMSLSVIDESGVHNISRFSVKEKEQDALTKRLLELKNFDLVNAWICSVVPDMQTHLVSKLKKLGFSVKIPKFNSIPMDICYEDPSVLGMDRLLCAYAAYKLYGDGLIVVDLGTAATIDLVGEGGKFLGGFIFPGFSVLKQSLYEHTALIKSDIYEHTLKNIAKFELGKSTSECVQKGVFLGFAGALRYIVDNIRSEFKTQLKLILTGADAMIIFSEIKDLVNVSDETLLFKGLWMIKSSEL